MTMQDASDFDPKCPLCGHEHVFPVCLDCRNVDGPCAMPLEETNSHPGEDTNFPEEDLYP
jgi:hypothetical protein